MQNKLLTLARPEILKMNAYRSARSIGTEGNIWLDANENPWNDNVYNRYPEPQPSPLVANLAAVYAVKPNQILITRGSDEGIDLLVRLFCRAGQDEVMICPPTYGMYKVAATIQNAGIVEVPLIKDNNFTLDLEKMLQAWQPKIKLIFLCSPNNPTGNLLDVSTILSLCEKLQDKSIVIVDEAYIEFSQNESMGKYLSVYSNLVVLRTLSKAYGLAGIRCGATLANPSIIELLKKVIAPYPIPDPIVNVVTKQLNSAVIQKQINEINKERNQLYGFLSQLTFIKKVWKSAANYLLFEAQNSKQIIKICLQNGIVLRDRSNEYNLNNCIRVTIGNAKENKFLRKILHEIK